MAAHDDEWSAQLRALIDATPPVATAAEAVRPMAGMEFTDADGIVRTLDFAAVKTLLRGARAAIRAVLQREGCPEFGEESALAIRLYTVERPFRLYAIVNGHMHAPDRAVGPGGASPGLRACLPFVRFLSDSLERAPQKFVYDGRCHRGVKFAFSSTGEAASAADHN